MRTTNTIYIVFILIVSLLTVSPVASGFEASPERKFSHQDSGSGDTGPMAYALQFFNKTISRADGRRCMMYPSCSHYSAQAFEKHGFIKGWIMTSDRLLRCGRDEKRIAEQIIIDKHVYVFDPLQRNDFWWSHP